MPHLRENTAPAGKHWRDRISDIGAALCARTGIAKQATVCALAVLTALPLSVFNATPARAEETRSLKLYFVHTKEKAVITYKRNGRFDQKGLQELNRFLRDWRRNQPTKMDPRLFDLVWEVYRRSGATDYITVVSAFRSPETNGMLRSRTKGVAKNSQHTMGKAMDFFIPGVKLTRLREIAMQMQVGGVGFYPTSGSPFVHLDVGSVRAWPRMRRDELARIFPDGKTIHLPADGKPLPGYDQAMADYRRRVGANAIQVASTAGPGPAGETVKKRKTLLSALFGGGGDEDEDPEAVATPAPSTRPAPVIAAREEIQVVSAPPARAAEAEVASIAAPLPQQRPAFRNQIAPADSGLATALYSPTRSAAQEALRDAMPATPVPVPAPESEFADLSNYKIPVPTMLGPRGLRGAAGGEGVVTASVDADALAASAADMHVPLPAARPAVAEALLAAADQATAQEEDGESVLSPIVVAAVDPRGQALRDAARAEVAAPAVTAVPAQAPAQVAPPAASASLPSPRPAAASAKPVAVAAANPSAAGSFGDVFDVKAAPEHGLKAGLPTRGGRPGKADADVSRQAMAGGGRLSHELISGWALNKSRSAVPVQSVKAPRVVSRTLNADVAANSYSSGFKPASNPVDPGRFSGPASARN